MERVVVDVVGTLTSPSSNIIPTRKEIETPRERETRRSSIQRESERRRLTFL